jgi:hypothetical protein
MRFKSYYKLPAPQTAQETCVAHNGSLIPIPGRDVMVQAWYQGGISVFDWTDSERPVEIAFFDRGPVDSTRLASGGYWSAYWYNGVIVGSEMARGLDIFELTPSAFVSRNEIEAAKSVRLDYFNVQGQTKLVWPATFSLARAYLDQLERSKGLAAGQIAAAREALAEAEKASDSERGERLMQLAASLEAEEGARDSAKVRTLAGVLKQVAAAPQVARGESSRGSDDTIRRRRPPYRFEAISRSAPAAARSTLNLKCGAPFSAVNRWPSSSNSTTITEPTGRPAA